MHDLQLSGLIAQLTSQGKTKEEIYLELLKQGRRVDDLNCCFEALQIKEERPDAFKRLIQIIVAFGAILVGAGIFAFIAADWAEMGKTMKVMIIVSGMLGTYAAGWLLKEKRGYAKTGESLIVLGTIIYGSGIFLVAQMFHIRANWPDGFLLWMLGAVAMGFAAESFMLFCMAIALGIVALISHPAMLFSDDIFYDAFLMTSSFLLALATAAAFFTGLYFRKKISCGKEGF